jgi:predicted dehydrogenase
VGVVGCGEIAQIMHLPLLHELPELAIGGLCDLSRTVLDALGEQYGVARRTTDYRELVGSDEIDAVVVCTYDHAPVAAAAIAAGKHVLVEKPVAFTPEEARPLVEAAEAGGLVAQVGYMKLYDRAVERAAEEVAAVEGLRAVHVHDFAGRFDRYPLLYSQVRGDDVPQDVLAASRADVLQRIAAALGEEHAGYAALYLLLLGLGSHDLAVLRAVCGAPERVLYAHARESSQLLAVLEYPGGVPCTLEIGLGRSYEWWDEWLAVYGESRELRLEFPNPYLRYATSVLRRRVGDDGSAAEHVVHVSHDSSFRREWQHFAACVHGEAPMRTPLAGGLADLELSMAIIRALPPRAAS